MEIDLHGHHPADMGFDTIAKIVQQAWEMGESELIIIHGHGRNRGISPGFVNTNTGYLGLTIRSALRSRDLGQWIFRTSLDRSDPGKTRVRLKKNSSPTRMDLDEDVLPEPRYNTPGPNW